MKQVAFFYPDLRTSQGWPDALSPLFKNLATVTSITYIASSGEKAEKSASTFDFGETDYLGSRSWLRLRDYIPEYLEVVSLGMLHFDFLKLILKIPVRSRIVILPLGQIEEFCLRRDVFLTDPSIQTQEAEALHLTPNSRNARLKIWRTWRWLLNARSRIAKESFLMAIGLVVAARRISVTLIPLSGNEAACIPPRIQKLLGASITRPISLPFSVSSRRLDDAQRALASSERVQSHVSLQGDRKRFNLVYFGRLEIEQKGLDVLLELIHYLSVENFLDVSLKLVGPGNQKTIDEIAEMVDSRGLGDIVDLVLPGDYVPGSLEPLARADFSVLLARWDGWPRACQESLALGTPVICSEESNFGDVIREHQCGLVLPRGDLRSDSFERVLLFLRGANLANLAANARAAAAACTGERAAKDLIDIVPLY